MIAQMQSAPAALPELIIFGPKSVKNCLNSSQSHLQWVIWMSLTLHLHTLQTLLVADMI